MTSAERTLTATASVAAFASAAPKRQLLALLSSVPSASALMGATAAQF